MITTRQVRTNKPTFQFQLDSFTIDCILSFIRKTAIQIHNL